MVKKFFLVFGLSLVVLGAAVTVAVLAGRKMAADQLYEQGTMKYFEDDRTGAQEDLDHALALNSGHAGARLLRGTLRNESGDFRGAVEDLDRALLGAPDNLEARFARASARDNLGDFTGALADYSEFLAAVPSDPNAHHNRAHSKRELGDFAGALADYAKTLELDGDYSFAYFSRGRLKLAQGDEPGALADLREAARKGVTYSAYWAFLAEAGAGRRAEAAAELAGFMEQQEQKPGDEWELLLGNFLLGAVSERQLFDRAAGAHNDFERRGRLCEAWFYAGLLKQQAGDTAGARAFYEKALGTNRGDFLEFWEAKRALKKLAAAPEKTPAPSVKN